MRGGEKAATWKRKAGGAKAEPFGCLGKIQRELGKGLFLVDRTPGFDAVLAGGELAAMSCLTGMGQDLLSGASKGTPMSPLRLASTLHPH